MVKTKVKPNAIDSDVAGHKEWSRPMELLCSIPPESSFILLSNLQKDFGYASQGDLRDDMAGIILTYGLRLFNVKKEGRCVNIPKRSWPKAQQDAERYWATVHGE